ncbi:WD40 repeat domain-containing protein [Anatilimnocola sp. NA78]|uniref:WD40 repeat domain-containing protein n=1 Tax=Anatilimnocola sp. NA78 TaxID=3415683 RepID=UPI003CE5694B
MQLVCQCSQCNKQYPVPITWGGRTTICQTCGVPMQVPAPPPGQLLPVAGMAVPPAVQGSSELYANLALAGVGAYALLIVLAFISFKAMKRPRGGDNVPVVAVVEPVKPAPQPVVPIEQPNRTIPAPPPPVRVAPPVAPPPEFKPAVTPQQEVTPTSPTPTELAKNDPPTLASINPFESTTTDPVPAPKPIRPEFGTDNSGPLSIPVSNKDEITLGPLGCPTLIVGNQAWNIAENRSVAELEGTYEKRGHKVLSPDGLTFAASSKSPNQQDTEVLVWDTRTGKQKFKVLGDPNKFADMVLLSNDTLYVGGRSEPTLDSFNTTTGAHLRTLTFGDARLRDDNHAITLDGKYIAIEVRRRLTVFRLSDGKQAAVMADPDNEAVFTLAWMQSLAFAPDSQELAMVSTHPSARLICWNTAGKVSRIGALPGDLRRAGSEERLEWFPDRNAWLVGNFVHDRESGMNVIVIKEKFAQDLQVAVHDADHLLGTFPAKPGLIEMFKIPWKEIRDSVAAFKAKEGAVLTSGTSVALRLELGKVQSDPKVTAEWLYAAMTARLNRDGIQVKEGAKTSLRLRYTESTVSEPTVGEIPAVEALGSLTIDLLQDGNAQPLWQKRILGPALAELAKQDVSDENVRNTMISRIRVGIADVEIPEFIPKSKDLPSLPIVLR